MTPPPPPPPSLPFSLHFRRSLEELIFFSIAKVWLLAENSYLRFSGGRALETLVKQHEEMSLFLKHFADKQHFPVFSDTTVDITMPVSCMASSQAILIKAFRCRTRSDHVTRNALAVRNNEAYGQGNGLRSYCTVLRYH